MLKQIVRAIDAKAGDKVFAMINGAGATTLMEQFIIFRHVKKSLAEKGIEIARAHVGEVLTVQEMGGFQMFMAKLDDELIKLWDAPCDTPFLTVR